MSSWVSEAGFFFILITCNSRKGSLEQTHTKRQKDRSIPTEQGVEEKKTDPINLEEKTLNELLGLCAFRETKYRLCKSL